MSPVRLARTAAGLQLATGWVLARHPRTGLRLLGYPQDTAGPRAVARLLGTRQLLQGAVLLRPTVAVLSGGAAVDALHALSCVGYARRSEVGRRAARRDAVLAVALGAAQALAAAQLRHAARHPRTPVPAPQQPEVPALPPRLEQDGERVRLLPASGAEAWSEPTDPRSDVLAGGLAERLVSLRGGVMDGAVVSVAPGADHYDIVNADEGPQGYRATGERDDSGWEVFALDGDRR